MGLFTPEIRAAQRIVRKHGNRLAAAGALTLAFAYSMIAAPSWFAGPLRAKIGIGGELARLAAINNRPEDLEGWLDQGVSAETSSPDDPEEITAPPENSSTLLELGIAVGYPKVVEVVLKHGGNPDHVRRHDETTKRQLHMRPQIRKLLASSESGRRLLRDYGISTRQK